MQDLPVAVELRGRLGAEVGGWVEAQGWQLVGLGGALAPSLVVAAEVVPGRPCVVVVEGSPTGEEVRAALQAGALDVVGWPQDAERLHALVVQGPRPAAGRPDGAPAPQRLAVAGGAGGVGTSTVALAVGALLAWAGREVLVIGDEDLLVLCGADPWTGPGAAELAPLDPVSQAEEVASLSRPVAGVPRLHVLGGGGGQVLDTGSWPYDAVVADLRTAGRMDAEIVCARPDAHLAASAGTRGAVLLIGDGPLGTAAVRAALGRPAAAHLPVSARVARAGAAGRVPSALPGSWVRALRAALVGGLR